MAPEEYKKKRIQLSLTQAELADVLELSRKSINRRELGLIAISKEAILAINSLKPKSESP